MDLDYESDCIFWADINTDKIMKQCLSNSSKVSNLVKSLSIFGKLSDFKTGPQQFQ